MEIKTKKTNDYGCLPQKAHPSDAGADLVASSMKLDLDNKIVTYGTGIAVEIPEGHVGLIFPRSSVYSRGLRLSNSVGVIDSHYRGEIMAKFDILEGTPSTKFYEVGERIAQMIILPYPEVEYVMVDKLTETDRGEGGYGSTGK